jgi:hypothetical protein
MKDTYSFKQMISGRDGNKGGVDPTHRSQCIAK